MARNVRFHLTSHLFVRYNLLHDSLCNIVAPAKHTNVQSRAHLHAFRIVRECLLQNSLGALHMKHFVIAQEKKTIDK